MSRRLVILAALAIAGAATTRVAGAQTAPETRRHLISINPLLAVAGFFTGEYEYAMARTASLAVGGSYWNIDDDGGEEVTYTSADVKLRYYPGARELRGFSLAGVVGYTSVEDEVFDGVTTTTERWNALALGTQLDYSWLLGEQQRFSVGLGIGAKRLFYLGDEPADEDVSFTIPTARVSVGIAF